MQVILDGLQLETMDYHEDVEISFACVTRDDAHCMGLSERLADDRVLELQHGNRHLLVRVSAHDVTPPYLRRMGGSLHRHEIRLQTVVAPARIASGAARIAAR